MPFFPLTRLIRYHASRMLQPIRLTFLATLFFAVVGCSNSTIIPANAPNTLLARQENDHAFDLIKEGKYRDAKPYLSRALIADPYFGPAHNNLGIVHYHLDSLDLAGREFESAIKYMPNQPDARNNLGLVFERLNKLTDAIIYYERAHKLAPESAEYLANLARARYKQDPRSPELPPILRELVMKTTSSEWRAWAELNLLRIAARPPEPPTTQPTTLPTTLPTPR